MDFPLAGVAVRAALARRRAGRVARRAHAAPTRTRCCCRAPTRCSASRVDDALLAALGKLVQKQVSPMRSTVTPSNYRRLVAAVLAQRLVRELAAAQPAAAEPRSDADACPQCHRPLAADDEASSICCAARAGTGAALDCGQISEGFAFAYGLLPALRRPAALLDAPRAGAAEPRRSKACAWPSRSSSAAAPSTSAPPPTAATRRCARCSAASR